MVMKSERAGRLARDSAEILVGDRPGEFTVVTQEGSSIPVDVRDLTESTSGKKEPLLEAASKPGQLQPATAQASTAAGPAVASAASGQPPSALTQSSAVTSATDALDAAQQRPDQSSAARKSTTWLGSMMAAGTAAFGLKGGAPADTGSTRLLQPAAQPGAAHAPASAGASSSAAVAAGASAAGAEHHLQQLPILNIAATEPKAEPPAVSAFASEVAVQPVSAATTDSSPIEGEAHFKSLMGSTLSVQVCFLPVEDGATIFALPGVSVACICWYSEPPHNRDCPEFVTCCRGITTCSCRLCCPHRKRSSVPTSGGCECAGGGGGQRVRRLGVPGVRAEGELAGGQASGEEPCVPMWHPALLPQTTHGSHGGSLHSLSGVPGAGGAPPQQEAAGSHIAHSHSQQHRQRHVD